MEHIAAAPDTDNFAISDFVFFPATEANVAAAGVVFVLVYVVIILVSIDAPHYSALIIWRHRLATILGCFLVIPTGSFHDKRTEVVV